MSEASERTEPAEPDGREFPCGSCGAELVYRPGSDVVHCRYCGHENPIAFTDEPLREIDFREMLARLASEKPRERHETVACASCGAVVDKPAQVEAMSCPYCAAPVVLEANPADLIRPEGVLPFKIDLGDAQERFRAWLGGLWFAPSGLARYAREQGRLEGVYLPHWTFDSRTTSDYRGQRGDDYWTTESYMGTGPDGKPQMKTRQVRRTRWTSVSGRVRVAFDDVLVPASRSLPAADLQALQPWDLGNLVAYEPEYLSGFRAEAYTIALDQGFDDAREVMDGRIRAAIEHDIGGDHQRIESVATRHEDVTFKHVLLPLWISAYRYREKVYRFVVNARTGEVRGERPWSFWKIFFTVLGVLLGILAVILLVGLFSGS